MTRKPGSAPVPPPLEMVCLAALWKLGPAKVSQIVAAVEPQHKLAYTTVLTLLTRLYERGEVNRTMIGKHYRYAAADPPDRIRNSAVEDLVRLYFDGSRDALVAWLNGSPAPAPQPPAPPENAIDTTLL